MGRSRSGVNIEKDGRDTADVSLPHILGIDVTILGSELK